jgi:hypothetical protein
MLPQTLFEWEVPFGVQICGIMGLGLLYAGSGDRYISDILLAEIGKLPVRYETKVDQTKDCFIFLVPVKKKWLFLNVKLMHLHLVLHLVLFYLKYRIHFFQF